MTSRKREPIKSTLPQTKPAETPEGREQQLVSLAVDVAEKQMRDGTASAQVISHYLKMGSTRERLEQQRLEREVQALEAKIQAMGSAKRVEELMEDALRAMREYTGQADDEEYDYED